MTGTGPTARSPPLWSNICLSRGLDIRIALGKVRDEVLDSTGNRQEPFVYGSLGGDDVALVPSPRAPSPATSGAGRRRRSQRHRRGRLRALPSGSAPSPAGKPSSAAHDSGYYANLARAQIAKLTVVVGPVAAKAGAVAVASRDVDRAAPPRDAPETSPSYSCGYDRDAQGRTAAATPARRPLRGSRNCGSTPGRTRSQSSHANSPVTTSVLKSPALWRASA